MNESCAHIEGLTAYYLPNTVLYTGPDHLRAINGVSALEENRSQYNGTHPESGIRKLQVI